MTGPGVLLNSTGVELIVVVVGANQHQGFGITSSHDPGYQLPYVGPSGFSYGQEANSSMNFTISAATMYSPFSCIYADRFPMDPEAVTR